MGVCRVGPRAAGGGEEVYWCGPLWLVGGAGPLEGGWGVGGRGRGSAPQQRRAWNTDSLLLPQARCPLPG